MKKLMLSTIVVGLLSINAMAVDGTVGAITIKDDASIKVSLIVDGVAKQGKLLVGTPEAVKSMYATILTAKSTNGGVALTPGTVDGVEGWKTVKFK